MNESILAGVGWLLIVGSIALIAFMVVVGIALFKKANARSWKAVIPVVNTIQFFDIMSSADYFWGMMLTGGLICILGYIIPQITLKTVLFVLGALICAAFEIYICIHGVKRFGKPVGFAVGLVLLPIVFFPILAFGKSTYNKEI